MREETRREGEKKRKMNMQPFRLKGKEKKGEKKKCYQ